MQKPPPTPNPTVTHGALRDPGPPTKKRGYGNDKIYRIIGGMHCLPLVDGTYVCGSASAIEARSDATVKQGAAEGESAVPQGDAHE